MNYQQVTRIIISNDINFEHQKIPINGRLSLQKGDGDFLMVEIPQEFLDQVYEAIQEKGMQKPDYRAHISVMSGNEMNDIEIEEVGEDITLNLGPIMSVNPENWDEMERVWFIECDAPRLKEIRQKYGLTPLIDEDHEFHITIAVKPKKEKNMKFSSKEKAIQYLSNLTGKKVVIAGNNQIKENIVNFIEDNKNPNDKKVYKFAKKLGIDVHNLEEQIHTISTQFTLFFNNRRLDKKEVKQEN